MSPIWNRRRFLSNLALSAVASRSVFALPPAAVPSYLAFVGIAPSDQLERGCIEVYRVQDARWSLIGTPVLTDKPHALALHPHLPVLYVAHRTAEHNHLPRGSVSAFGFDEASGELELLGRQPLALSATHPDSITVSPNGRSLMVGASTGGAWNFFSLASDGTILPTPASLKLAGSGPHPSQWSPRPHTIVCHPSAHHAYATDFGSDRIDQIALHETPRSDDSFSGPAFTRRVGVAAGSGPAHLVLHPSGRMLVAAHQLRPALSMFAIDSAGNMSPNQEHILPLDADSTGPLVSNRSGDRLYLLSRRRSGATALGVFAWSASSGRLRPIQNLDLQTGSLPAQMTALEHELVVVSSRGVDRIALHQANGACSALQRVLTKPGAVSLATYLL
jgi:6-phosphogluconolactonase (cycloisomerase 2 family)